MFWLVAFLSAGHTDFVMAVGEIYGPLLAYFSWARYSNNIDKWLSNQFLRHESLQVEYLMIDVIRVWRLTWKANLQESFHSEVKGMFFIIVGFWWLTPLALVGRGGLWMNYLSTIFPPICGCSLDSCKLRLPASRHHHRATKVGSSKMCAPISDTSSQHLWIEKETARN